MSTNIEVELEASKSKFSALGLGFKQKELSSAKMSSNQTSAIDSLRIPEEKKRYINETLNPVLSELVTDCLKACPEDPPTYMFEWLRQKKGLAEVDVNKLCVCFFS